MEAQPATALPYDLISDTYNSKSAILEDNNDENSAKLFPSLLAKEASVEAAYDKLPTTEEAPPGTLRSNSTEETTPCYVHSIGTEEATLGNVQSNGTKEATPGNVHSNGTEEATSGNVHYNFNEEATPGKVHSNGTEKAPSGSLSLIEEDFDYPPKRLQPSRKARPKEGAVGEDWLQDHLRTQYPDKKQWRALELFVEEALRKTFPEAEILAQATEVTGIRPDLVMREGGRTVVLDAKHYVAGNIRKRADVDKLLRDMDAYDASSGVLVVLDDGRISDSLRRYCENHGVAIVEANRQLASNLRKAITGAPVRRSSNAGGPLKKDGTPDMRFKKNYDRRSSNADAFGPLRKDGMPDMRFKVNQERRNSKMEALAPLKNQGRKDGTSEALGPLKKDGSPDMRFKANQGRRNSDALGPLKKDGKPDMRYKANYEQLPVNTTSLKKEYLPSITNRYIGPLKKDGTPDMRYKANYELPPMRHSRISYPGFTGSQYHSYNGNTSGPLTKAGLPDMRYKANRY